MEPVFAAFPLQVAVSVREDWSSALLFSLRRPFLEGRPLSKGGFPAPSRNVFAYAASNALASSGHMVPQQKGL
jgi:hypothetical protein